MSSTGWQFIEVASLLLESDERIVVCGDLAECEETCAQALMGIFGLFIRRQIELWRRWQVWLALLGIAGLTGYALSGFVLGLDSDLSIQIRTYQHYGVHYEMGVSATQDVLYLVWAFLSLLVWSWISGAVLGSLSGRSVWLTAILFYLVVAFAAPIAFVFFSHQTVLAYWPWWVSMLFLHPAKICFLVAAFHGITFGTRKTTLAMPQASVLTLVSVVAIILMLWSGGWYEDAKGIISGGAWQGVPWIKRIIPFLFISWPVIYFLGTSRTYGGKLSINNVSR